jgi:hypothetical protein
MLFDNAILIIIIISDNIIKQWYSNNDINNIVINYILFSLIYLSI